MVPLSYRLQNGDIVEVMTSKNATGPSQDWLNIVETSRARNKIRQWFSRERREDERHEGKEALDRAMRKRGVPFQRREVTRILTQLASEMHLATVEDLYRQIGSGHISANIMASKVAQYLGEEKKPVIVPERESVPRPRPESAEIDDARLSQRIRVHGIDNALVQVAHCCYPAPGDPIVGFVTRGRGVSVHRDNCTNVHDLSRESDRLIKVTWEKDAPKVRMVEICVEAWDRPKLVRDITTVLGDQGVNILSASFSADSMHLSKSNFVFEIGSNVHLEDILKDLKKLDSVIDIFEISADEETAGS
jgi:GTP pyrophosphokinase